MTLWFCAPPSDQEENSHTLGKDPCGEVACTELTDPTMTVCVNGVACGADVPTVSRSPEGLDRKFRVAVCGWMLTLAVPVSSCESVAVSWISRYDGYSWSGAGKDPPATPENVW